MVYIISMTSSDNIYHEYRPFLLMIFGPYHNFEQ